MKNKISFQNIIFLYETRITTFIPNADKDSTKNGGKKTIILLHISAKFYIKY